MPWGARTFTNVLFYASTGFAVERVQSLMEKKTLLQNLLFSRLDAQQGRLGRAKELLAGRPALAE